MQKHLEILSRAVAQWTHADKPVVQAINAPELEKLIDVSLAEAGVGLDGLEKPIQDYLHYSPNSADPEFYKLLYSGVNKEALLGDWITSLTNVTMHTYQVGPVATLMELELIRQWNSLLGFDDGDGVMVAGGSQANLIGMMLARHRACPDFKTKGTNGTRRLVAYVSDQSHYSNQRAVNILGIGTDNLVSVESDADGRIIPQALEAAIKRDLEAGRQPFYIGLTAGSTVIGAFDPIKACSEIAVKSNCWLHVDGAWGAPVLFSDTHRHLLADCHLADSFAWDAHKQMNVPITAAVILLKHKGALQDCTAGGGGEYLFHADENSDYNLGEKSIQCGRRADALKVWLSWKAIGSNGFADKIDCLQRLKNNCVEQIEQTQNLQMLAPAVYLNVLFRYRPEAWQDEDAIARLNVEICKRMRQNGGPYVDYARYKGRTGIRLILANELTTKAHVERLLNECQRIGRALS